MHILHSLDSPDTYLVQPVPLADLVEERVDGVKVAHGVLRGDAAGQVGEAHEVCGVQGQQKRAGEGDMATCKRTAASG
jgi:hypothetical protein